MMTLALLAAVLMPPAKFDHEPRVPYTVSYVSPPEIERRCDCLDLMVARLTDRQARALGCTDLKTTHIWIDDSLDGLTRALVLRHEQAHVNGWRHLGSPAH